MKFIYCFLVLSLCHLTLQAQFTCETMEAEEVSATIRAATCNNNNVSNNPDRYKDQENFIPSMFQPVKTVRISFHIIQNSQQAGNAGNFENTPADIAFLHDLVAKSNHLLSNVAPPLFPQNCVCGSGCHLPDTRIRLELQGIYFHYEPSLYLSGSIGTMMNNIGYQTSEVIHIFFNGDTGGFAGGAANTPSKTSLGATHGIRLTNYNHSYESELANSNPNLSWSATVLANNMTHELGHSFGLLHTYSQTCCAETTDPNDYEYIDDFWGTGTGGCPQLPMPAANWCCSGPDNSCSKNWMGGFCPTSTREVTPQQMGRVHRNAMLTSFRKFVKPSSNLESDHIVSSNETWDFDIRMYSNIVVQNGATLTIRCQVLMPPFSNIKVQPGGTLIVDGGTITSVDDDHNWHGIQVHGNNTKSQFLENGVMYQGKLITKNDAVIENALDAIQLWEPGNWNSPGGIVQASETTFRNNRRSAEFIAYQNHIPNNPQVTLDNVSYFTLCNFVNDAPMNNGSNYMAMVSLWEVTGVKFSGCSFAYDFNTNQHTKGIASVNAGYRVYQKCTGGGLLPCPNSNIVKSSFRNLTTGIEATGALCYNPVSVQQTEFEDCYRGIIIDEVDDCSIVDNEFTAENDFVYVGVYIANATGFTVEGNTFTSGNETFYYGIRVDDSGSNYNELYRNTFNDNIRGVIVVGQNFKLHNHTIYDGLKFLCNDFNNSTYSDIYVLSSATAAMHQGGMTSNNQFIPAGNAFSQNGAQHYHHTPSLQALYYHSSASVETPTNYQNIIPIPLGTQNGCGPKKSNTLGYQMESGLVDQVAGRIIIVNNGLQAAVNDYELQVDGGDTGGLIGLINGSSADQADELQTNLLDASPLSHEVALASVNAQILSHDQLFEVLHTNAQVVRDESILQALENMADPMPEEMITNLVAESLNPQYKDELEQVIGDFRALRRADHLSLLNHYGLLQEEGDYDKLYHWISFLGEEHYGRLRKIDFLTTGNQLDAAQQEIANWQDVSYDNSNFVEEREKVSAFFGPYTENMISGENKIWPEDPDFFSYLDGVKAEDNDHTSAMAANLIRFNEQAEYIIPEVVIREEQQSRFAYYLDKLFASISPEDIKVSAFPNPSDGSFSIKITDYRQQRLNYDIFDINGRIVGQGMIANAITDVQLALSTGTYFIRFTQAGKQVGRLKVTIK